jgi:undecaprenyl diphosphate synthase
LPAAVLSELREVERKTAKNEQMTVLLAVSYGAREEIVRAMRTLARRVRDGALTPEQIGEREVAAALSTADVPDPDLLIRTSGEMRLSNFLLWQLAYTELYVTDTLWPDFREKEFVLALDEYRRRQRRFGRTIEQVAEEA